MKRQEKSMWKKVQKARKYNPNKRKPSQRFKKLQKKFIND